MTLGKNLSHETVSKNKKKNWAGLGIEPTTPRLLRSSLYHQSTLRPTLGNLLHAHWSRQPVSLLLTTGLGGLTPRTLEN